MGQTSERWRVLITVRRAVKHVRETWKLPHTVGLGFALACAGLPAASYIPIWLKVALLLIAVLLLWWAVYDGVLGRMPVLQKCFIGVGVGGALLGLVIPMIASVLRGENPYTHERDLFVISEPAIKMSDKPVIKVTHHSPSPAPSRKPAQKKPSPSHAP